MLGEGKCNSSACDYQRVWVFKGYPNLHWLLRSRGIFFKFSLIRNIDLTAPSFLKMRWPVIIQMLGSNTKILLHAKLMLFQRTGTQTSLCSNIGIKMQNPCFIFINQISLGEIFRAIAFNSQDSDQNTKFVKSKMYSSLGFWFKLL